MFKKILVATDGSELSEKAVAGAIGMARQHAAELVAFSVLRRFARSFMEGTSLHEVGDGERIDQERTQKAQQLLDTIVERARMQQVRCEARLAHSSLIAESIIEAAKDCGCDLIVMASHGRGGIGRLLLGSETLQVLTHSKLPVLVLR